MSDLTPERWQRARQLFQLALQEPQAERDAWLRAGAPDDAALRAEVAALLEAHESAEDLPPVDRGQLGEALDALSLNPTLENQRLGPWLVEQRLGRGGMGEVFVASRADGVYAGKVALKIVRVGMDSPEMVARFEAERQILARLAHPNIARLLDGGLSPDGRPYLVLELIDGEPLIEFARQRQLSVVDRVRLFLEICEAVSYAHGCLVVHRDLKPSNVLVTREGRPILLDFGIAKLIDQDDLGGPQETRSRVLTPGYASPEQYRGAAVTTASDVYSLGVVLYELLTGSLPWPVTKDSAAIPAYAITGDEPEPASVRLARSAGSGDVRPARRLKGDLDIIVGTALRHDPARRYRTAERFAEDLRRHLSGLPIVARGNAWTYRAQKFVTRHRAAVAAGTLAVVARVLGLAATVWQRRHAEQNFADARALANAMLFDVHDEIARVPGSTAARRRLVTEAVRYLDRLSARGQGDAELQLELVKGYLRIGSVLGNPLGPNLGDTLGALANYEKARVTLGALPRAIARSKDARICGYQLDEELASIHYWASDYDNARAAQQRAQVTAESLATDFPDDPRGLQHVCATETLAGDIEYWGGTNDKALVHYNACITRVAPAVARWPDNLDVSMALAVALSRAGDALSWADKPAEAESLLARAVEIQERLLEKQPGDPRISNSLIIARSRQAETESTLGRTDAALATLEPAVRLGEAMLAADPQDVMAKSNLSVVYAILGDVYEHRREYQTATATIQKALALRRDLAAAAPLNPDPQRSVATVLQELAAVAETQGDWSGALRKYDAAVAILRPLHASHPVDPQIHRDLAAWLTASARMVARQNRSAAHAPYAEAAALWKELDAKGALKAFDRTLMHEAEVGATGRRGTPTK